MLKDDFATVELDQFDVIEQVLKLCLTHRCEYFERLQELNSTQEISLNGFFDDSNVRFTIDARYFTVFHALVGHQVWFRLDKGNLTEIVPWSKFAEIFEQPDFLSVRVFGNVIGRSLLLCFFQGFISREKTCPACKPRLGSLTLAEA